MAERSACSERLCVLAPVVIGTLTLLPVARTGIRVRHGPAPLLWCLATREPVALVVRDATGTRAFGVDGAPAALEPLLDAVEGLAQALHPDEPDASGADVAG